MKKRIIFSLLITGCVGFVLWQYDFTHQGGAGETRPVAVVNQADNATGNNINNVFAEQEKDGPEKSVVVPIQNSDDIIGIKPSADENLKNYLATAKPDKIKEYYAKLRQARAELVLNQLNAEQPDQRWADELTQKFQVANTLVPGLPKLDIAESDCRETICALQIDMKKGTYKKYAPYMQHIGTVLGMDTWVHHDAKPDAAVIYVARAEASLPKLDLRKGN